MTDFAKVTWMLHHWRTQNTKTSHS